MKRKYLVLVRAGDNSLHTAWLKDPNRDFDILASCYGRNADKYREGVEHWRAKGLRKWAAIHEHMSEEPELIGSYDAVWMPDDDLELEAAAINRMFAAFAAFELSLGQPALSKDSHFSHEFVLADPKYYVRFTNFVEVMAPIFSRRALALLRGTFQHSTYGWGLDYLWPHLLAQDTMTHRIGILDMIQMRHTRPVGGGDIYQGSASRGEDDFVNLQRLYPDSVMCTKRQQAGFKVLGGARNEKSGPLRTMLANVRRRLFPC